jgi:signal transduction histidine kinase/HAMP domain-containing protein
VHLSPWRTVRGRLVLAALLIEAVMLAMLVGNGLRLLREAMGDQAREQAQQIAPVLSAALVAPLAQYDYATVQAVLNESQAIRGIEYLAVTDATGRTVATSGWPAGQPLPAVDAQFSLDDSPPRYDLAVPIKVSGQALGTLQFGLDLTRIVVARKNLLGQGLLIAGGELLLSAGLLTLLGLLITRQLSVLTAASLKVAEGELTPAAVPEGRDDVGRLGAAFNTMSRAMAERVEQLTQANEQTARAAASLRERTAQLNAIFELSPDGFVSFDEQDRVLYASPAFFRMTGLVPEHTLGLTESDFSARLAGACLAAARFPGVAVLRQAAQAAITAAETGARRHRLLIELAGPDKQVLEVALRLSDAGSVSQILFCRDVTHEIEVDRMKTEFLSHAAHELRTPMASIYGFSEMMLMRRFSDERRQEIVGIVHRQSKLMISIINELLDLVRIDDRRGQDFDFVVLDAGDLVREVVADFGVPDGQTAARVEVPARSWPLRADARKLMQAVRNLLSNAYKYSPGGGPVVVSLVVERGTADAAARVGIRVADHGLGMTPEQVVRVCERFYRADTSGSIPGTGLGMSIVKEIITLHGGEVAITSRPGVGTTVTLWLPAVAEEAVPA